MKRARTALVSVFSKEGLEELVRTFSEYDILIYSTGGTHSFIENLGIPVKKVEDLTSYPSILGGRVKTLHPKVFGGILARREEENDLGELSDFQIPEIDIVVVDLYPFEETVASGGSDSEIIEKIDIGGVSLIRAAAKNHKDVLIVPNRQAYAQTVQILRANKGATELEDRTTMAKNAFSITSNYDNAIHNWMNGEVNLRYGENPHQKASFKGNLKEAFTQLCGKSLSYNNLLDIDAAWWMLKEFEDSTFTIIKHNNACGLASRPSVEESWDAALQADPVSAFGGILATNTEVDAKTATKIQSLFFEVLMAPSFSSDALEILKGKKNRVILQTYPFERTAKQIRSVLNGYLEQDFDTHSDTLEDFVYATDLKPSNQEVEDLLFASKICKHTKSNTIVLVKNKQLLASGTGQTSRVDALKQAIVKAKAFGFDLKGAVMASDAFFPFPDCVEIAHMEGIDTIIQPGGSIKDNLSTDYCNLNRMRMILTGYRHFKH